MDLDDHATDALALAVTLVPRLLAPRHHGFHPSEVDDDVAALEASHGAIEHVSDLLFVFVEDLFSLSLADTLVEHLLCRLSGDAA